MMLPPYFSLAIRFFNSKLRMEYWRKASPAFVIAWKRIFC